MRRAVRNPVLLVIAGLMLLQTAWILTIPPFRGSDEIDHAYRAASVARGEWVVGPTAEDGRGQLVPVPRSLVVAAGPQCERFDYMGPDNCRPVSTQRDGSVLIATAAGVYHPAYYWVVGVAGSPFEGATALYVMRATSALLCLVFFGFAAFALGRLPGRWPYAALALATTPVLVYSTTIIAPNGLEMSAALCLWGSLLALIRAEDGTAERRLLWIAIAAGVVMGTLRPLGPVYILMIVATIALLDWRSLWSVLRRHVMVMLAGVLLVGAAALALAAWTAGHSGYSAGDLSGDESPKFRPRNLLFWQFQSIAAFPLRNDVGPLVVYVVVVVLALALVLWAFRSGTRRERLVLGSSVGLFIGFPVAFMLSPLGPDANFWQGRYGLPYGVGVLLVAGWVLAGRHGTNGLNVPTTITATTTYAAAVAACWIKIRNDELASNAASAGDDAWHAPSLLLLVALGALVALLFFGALRRSADPPSAGAHRTDENVSARGGTCG